MSTYEMMVLLRDGLEKKDKEATLATISQMVGEGKGKIIKEDSLGKKTLAYPINKETEAEYYLFEIEGEGDGLGPLNKKLRLSDAVLRYLIMKKD